MGQIVKQMSNQSTRYYWYPGDKKEWLRGAIALAFGWAAFGLLHFLTHGTLLAAVAGTSVTAAVAGLNFGRRDSRELARFAELAKSKPARRQTAAHTGRAVWRGLAEGTGGAAAAVLIVNLSQRGFMADWLLPVVPAVVGALAHQIGGMYEHLATSHTTVGPAKKPAVTRGAGNLRSASAGSSDSATALGRAASGLALYGAAASGVGGRGAAVLGAPLSVAGRGDAEVSCSAGALVSIGALDGDTGAADHVAMGVNEVGIDGAVSNVAVFRHPAGAASMRAADGGVGSAPDAAATKALASAFKDSAFKASAPAGPTPKRSARDSALRRSASRGSAPGGSASKGSASKGSASRGSASRGSAFRSSAGKGSASKGSASRARPHEAVAYKASPMHAPVALPPNVSKVTIRKPPMPISAAISARADAARITAALGDMTYPATD